MTEDNGFSRREALKTGAKVAGVAAFATPVVVGAFNTRVSAAGAQCNPETDSFVIPGVDIDGSQSWNQNCGNSVTGRYNGQNRAVTLANGEGVIVRVGNDGNDNFDVDISYYIVLSDDYECTATFTLDECGGTGQPEILMSTDGGNWPDGASALPWCHVCPQDPLRDPDTLGSPSNRLVLAEVFCCPK